MANKELEISKALIEAQQKIIDYQERNAKLAEENRDLKEKAKNVESLDEHVQWLAKDHERISKIMYRQEKAIQSFLDKNSELSVQLSKMVAKKSDAIQKIQEIVAVLTDSFECDICHLSMGGQDRAPLFSVCEHSFCTTCVRAFILKGSSCPICRREVWRTGEVRKNVVLAKLCETAADVGQRLESISKDM